MKGYSPAAVTSVFGEPAGVAWMLFAPGAVRFAFVTVAYCDFATATAALPTFVSKLMLNVEGRSISSVIAVEMPAVELVALVTGDSPCQPTMVPELALAV